MMAQSQLLPFTGDMKHRGTATLEHDSTHDDLVSFPSPRPLDETARGSLAAPCTDPAEQLQPC